MRAICARALSRPETRAPAEVNTVGRSVGQSGGASMAAARGQYATRAPVCKLCARQMDGGGGGTRKRLARRAPAEQEKEEEEEEEEKEEEVVVEEVVVEGGEAEGVERGGAA